MAKRLSLQIPGVAHSGGRERGFLPFGAKVGNMLFSGGTMGQDPASGQVAADPQRQAELAFQNTRTLLETAGMSTDDIVHFFVWLKDREYQQVVNKPWAEMFPDQHSRPARHAIVRPLPGDMVVQLEVVAVQGGAGSRRRISYEIPGVAHTGGASPGFIPFGSQVGNVLCSGGSFGRDPKTDKMGETAEAQAELAFMNTRTLLETAGFTPEDVAHIFVWLKDRKYQDAVNKPYAEMFPNPASRPARHSIVADLPGEMMVQIDIMAAKGGKRESINIPGVSHATGGGNNFLPFATKIGNTLFSSGIMGRDPANNEMAKTPERQAELCFQNMRTMLDKAGFTTDDIGHMFVWYSDHQYRDVVNGPWVEMFPDVNNRPARHAIVADLPNDMVVQLEVVAAQ